MPKDKEAGREAGKDVLSYCTSCKMDLNHIIVAMKGDQVAKVECNTCKKIHAYRAPKGITEPPAKKETKAQKKAAAEAAEAENAKVAVQAEWERLMNAQKNAQLKPYSLKGSFKLGDKIGHPTFGEGVVNKLHYPNKIEVIFKNDIKVLIHAGSAQA